MLLFGCKFLLLLLFPFMCSLLCFLGLGGFIVVLGFGFLRKNSKLSRKEGVRNYKDLGKGKNRVKIYFN